MKVALLVAGIPTLASISLVIWLWAVYVLGSLPEEERRTMHRLVTGGGT